MRERYSGVNVCTALGRVHDEKEISEEKWLYKIGPSLAVRK
jgi:hypothetical protein